LNFAEIFGVSALEYRVWRCLRDSTRCRFSGTPTCDRRSYLHTTHAFVRRLSAGVRRVNATICQVSGHRQAHPEYRRLSDRQHFLIHGARPLREGQVSLQRPHDAQDPAAGQSRRTRGVPVLHQRSTTCLYLFVLCSNVFVTAESNSVIEGHFVAVCIICCSLKETELGDMCLTPVGQWRSSPVFTSTGLTSCSRQRRHAADRDAGCRYQFCDNLLLYLF